MLTDTNIVVVSGIAVALVYRPIYCMHNDIPHMVLSVYRYSVILYCLCLGSVYCCYCWKSLLDEQVTASTQRVHSICWYLQHSNDYTAHIHTHTSKCISIPTTYTATIASYKRHKSRSICSYIIFIVHCIMVNYKARSNSKRFSIRSTWVLRELIRC